MGRNFEKEFFEQFKGSSVEGRPLDSCSDSYADNDQADEFAELGELILRFQDGRINQEQFKRLQDWLLNDYGALRHYVEYGYLCAGLNILLNKKQGVIFLSPPLTV